jgi:hypothetical protein
MIYNSYSSMTQEERNAYCLRLQHEIDQQNQAMLQPDQPVEPPVEAYLGEIIETCDS